MQKEVTVPAVGVTTKGTVNTGVGVVTTINNTAGGNPRTHRFQELVEQSETNLVAAMTKVKN